MRVLGSVAGRAFFIGLLCLLMSTESAEGRFRKSGFIKAGLGVARQFFKKSGDENNFILNPDYKENKGWTHTLDGYHAFSEFYLTNSISAGLRYAVLENENKDLSGDFSRKNRLLIRTVEISYGFEVGRRIDFFKSSVLEAGIGLGYGYADWVSDPDSETVTGLHLPGTTQQVILYLDYGGYGFGFRSKIIYNDFTWREPDDLDFENPQSDFDYVTLSLDFRFSFYNRRPIFQ